jgi:exodeoxyribonuclease VII large subunit
VLQSSDAIHDATITLNTIPQHLSVSALNRLVRTTLEGRFPLLWVVGEISNLTRAASGHFYFTLKDDTAQVRSVMFRNRAQLLPWRLEEGQQVEAQVLVSLYEARGDYQLTIESLRRNGTGRLYEAFARLRERLEIEGLFSSNRKQVLPRFPKRIAIVTSAQAAALQDILTALTRRAPHLSATIFPTLVQGEAAPAQIVAAIEAAGRNSHVDLIILARGGGSIEDLWAFNDEAVARAIAACPLPVVSGVGHETDTTIADLVADARAATPTAAAELASAGWFAARGELETLHIALQRQVERKVEANMQSLDLLSRRLIHPGERLARQQQLVAHLSTRLSAATQRRMQAHETTLSSLSLRLLRKRVQPEVSQSHLTLLRQRLTTAMRTTLGGHRQTLAQSAAALFHLDPDATLARGYTIVRDATGNIVRDMPQLHPGDPISLQFSKGKARARILSVGDPTAEKSP